MESRQFEMELFYGHGDGPGGREVHAPTEEFMTALSALKRVLRGYGMGAGSLTPGNYRRVVTDDVITLACRGENPMRFSA